MLIEVPILMPDTRIVLELTWALRGASVCGAKLNASGVVSAAAVVTLKFSETVPTVNVAVVVVLGAAEEVMRT